MFICEYDYTVQPLDRSHITKEAKGYSPNNKEITDDEYTKAHSMFASKYTTREQWNKYTQQVNNNLYCFVLDGDVYFCLILNPGLNGEQIYYGLQKNN